MYHDKSSIQLGIATKIAMTILLKLKNGGHINFESTSGYSKRDKGDGVGNNVSISLGSSVDFEIRRIHSSSTNGIEELNLEDIMRWVGNILISKKLSFVIRALDLLNIDITEDEQARELFKKVLRNAHTHYGNINYTSDDYIGDMFEICKLMVSELAPYANIIDGGYYGGAIDTAAGFLLTIQLRRSKWLDTDNDAFNHVFDQMGGFAGIEKFHAENPGELLAMVHAHDTDPE